MIIVLVCKCWKFSELFWQFPFFPIFYLNKKDKLVLSFYTFTYAFYEFKIKSFQYLKAIEILNWLHVFPWLQGVQCVEVEERSWKYGGYGMCMLIYKSKSWYYCISIWCMGCTHSSLTFATVETLKIIWDWDMYSIAQNIPITQDLHCIITKFSMGASRFPSKFITSLFDRCTFSIANF